MPHQPPRFPYWKIQYYMEKNLAWLDVQKQYFSKEEAEAEARCLGKKRVRLMQVEGAGGKKRIPLPEIEIQD